MAACPKCGTDNPDDNDFCWSCGSAMKEKENTRTAADVKVHTSTTTTAPPKQKSGKGAIMAVILVLIVLVAAGGAIYYFSQEDDGPKHYDNTYQLPEDHPLYGKNNPDGRYIYDAEITYQGTTMNVDVEIGFKDGIYDYYAIGDQVLTQSELDQLNEEQFSYGFTIRDGDPWNDGTKTYDIYILDFGEAGISYVTEDAVIVYNVTDMDGMHIEMTLKGWSEGEDDTPEYIVDFFYGGEFYTSKFVKEGDLVPEPYIDLPDGVYIKGYKTTDGYWDIDNDRVTGHIRLIIETVEHVTVNLDASTLIIQLDPFFDSADTHVIWGDGTGDYQSSRAYSHVYTSTGSYTVTVTSVMDGETYETTKSVSVSQLSKFNVRFENSGSYSSRIVTAGDKLDEPSSSVRDDGYVLAGWTSSLDGSHWDFDGDRVVNDMTLTADYQRHFTIANNVGIGGVYLQGEFKGQVFTVDWGDGTVELISDADNASHTYAADMTGYITVTSTDDAGHAYTSKMPIEVELDPSKPPSAGGIEGGVED